MYLSSSPWDIFELEQHMYQEQVYPEKGQISAIRSASQLMRVRWRCPLLVDIPPTSCNQPLTSCPNGLMPSGGYVPEPSPREHSTP
ncbi:hypothetical protein Aduo_001437 [Ancylostoma duodenale]